MLFQQELPEPDGEVITWLTSFTVADLPQLIVRLFVSMLIFLIGRYLITLLVRALRNNLTKRKLDTLTIDFIAKSVTIAGLLIVGIIALANLGIPMTPLITIVGAAAIAIGLALQDTLANLASGLLIIMLHPYKEEDSVEVGENRLTGTIDSVQFFHTVLRTPDNSLLLIPNSEVMGNPILNFTELGWRRIDMKFTIGYNDDLRLAKQILEEIAAADPRILLEPAAIIAVQALGENGVDLAFQPHVNPADYADVKYYLNEQVKLRFDEAGIAIAAPQRTIRLLPGVGPQSDQTPSNSGR